MAILTVVLGVIFVLLMLSLFATSIMELLAAMLRLRGRNLKMTLKNLLIDEKKGSSGVYEAFITNPLYKQLSFKYGRGVSNPPSYIDNDSFRTILFDIILGEDGLESQLKTKIDALENDEMRRILKQLIRDADGKIDVFKQRIGEWYESIMDRASGYYKRMTQKILIIVGIVMAVVLNADTLALYRSLETNPETLDKLVAAAEAVAENESVDGMVRTDLEYEAALEQVRRMKGNVDDLRSPLGMGWQNINLAEMSVYNWAVKILGWIITAIAISLGAPFWFDLLRKIVNLRSTGEKPAD
ncbi:hypothetical protein CRP01_33970 [Flavilitoribacter nigricans DSM 23189 = NBRC 102662]|uniref:Uncharacterized protein n=2 Tax=Flavilitoribacter TaxID=2762562 RepID=A0A2D0N104_FLAN2|nr:hypothetical protein CRP01_33970 [Flavilitoribacter nigricans DSM 23189 = NBRC 102662]